MVKSYNPIMMLCVHVRTNLAPVYVNIGNNDKPLDV